MTYRTSRPKLRIDLGEQVLHRRTGRIGYTTQVNIDQVWVRFDANERARQLDRRDVVPLRWIEAMREVDEDEANAAAFRASLR